MHIQTIAIVVGADVTLSNSTNYSYALSLNKSVSSGTTLVATAATPFGVAYALETLAQLLASDDGQIGCGELVIRDAPAFVHRGLMIDTGRRFYPVPLVKSLVDGLASAKMNVLHFHLSEQCFRVQSLRYPELTATCVDGSKNNTAFYTQAQIKDLVAYARLRGVRVIPEFGKQEN